MWIQVRSMDGRQSVRINGLSKLTKVEDLRQKLSQPFKAKPEQQRLFYRGKQLEDGHSLFDYSVALNDIVQIMVRPLSALLQPSFRDDQEKSDGTSSGYESSCSNNDCPEGEDVIPKAKPTEENEKKVPLWSEEEVARSQFYKVGDTIDAKDLETGSWFEAKISKIIKTRFTSKGSSSAISTVETNSVDSGSQTVSDADPASISIQGCSDLVTKVPASAEKRSRASKKSQAPTSDVVPEVVEVCDDNEDAEFTFAVSYVGYEDDEPIPMKFRDIRPRARTKIRYEDVKIGDVIMANYNIDDPQERGYWFDFCITSVSTNRLLREMTGTIFVGASSTPLYNCKICYVDEVYRIEAPVKLMKRSDEMEYFMQIHEHDKRFYKPNCTHCKDNPRRKCKECACHNCGEKANPDKQILCDECNAAFHIWCLTPPLDQVPNDEEWFCPLCKVDTSEVVRAGEKLKESKKRAKLASAAATCSRDWGKGMACVGRTKQCTIVPPNHFGPIPGIEVGTIWKFRVQVSEAGIHRPHVSGIHGRGLDGAYSIVLAGGYEDDVDDGDEFTYTGSGGRDLSGNKRTAEQSSDQILTRMNLALAINCNAAINKTNGAEAANWQKGKPVRVVRSYKGRKHSKYCPEDGNRYDGIYKIVKYWPEKGKSGHIVWRYKLRRDDPNPGPWTKAGQKRCKELGLEMQYPDGYLEEMAEKQAGCLTPSDKEKRKRIAEGSTPSEKRKRIPEASADTPSRKRARHQNSLLPDDVAKLIKEDSRNSRLWEECMETIDEGMQKFVAKVEELFMCICCQEVVFKPITTECKHNICQPCLTRSFKAQVYSCPTCRQDLDKNCSTSLNKVLRQILQQLLPGYENGR